ncbi:MAG: hypothetical protein AB8B78_04560 [Polaribacter sp.]
MRDKKHIDRLFQEKFKDFEVKPNANVWANIEKRIEAPKKNTRTGLPFWLRFTSVAAALIVFFAFGNLYLNTDNKENNNTTIVDSNKNSENKKTNNQESNLNTKAKTFNTISNSNKENTNSNSTNTVTSNTIDNPKEKTNFIDTKVLAVENVTNKNAANTDTKLLKQNKNKSSSLSGNSESKNLKNTKEYLLSQKNNLPETNITSITQNNNTKKSNSATKNKSINTTDFVSNNNNSSNVNKAINTSENNSFTQNSTKKSYANNINSSVSKNRTKKLNSASSNKNKTDFVSNNSNSSNTNSVMNTNTTENNNVSANKLIVVNNNEKEEEKLMEPDSANSSNAIEEALAKTEENLDEKERSINRWSVSANAAPVYYNTLGKGSHIHEQFISNPKSSEVNTSYGVNVGYIFNDRLKVRSGLNKLNLSYNTANVIVYENVTVAPKTSPLNNIDFTPTKDGQNISVLSSNNLSVQQIEGLINNDLNAALSQRLSYFEVPLELEYALVNKRFGFNIIGGFSTFILNDNEVVTEVDNRKTKIGEANNINNLSFSTNLGIGIDYKFSNALKFNLEPTFKYQINAYSETSGNFRPYIIGVYTGISYKF